MTEHETPTDTADVVLPLQQRRRVKRGIVASYIHEISERHRNGEAPGEDGGVEAMERSEDG